MAHLSIIELGLIQTEDMPYNSYAGDDVDCMSLFFLGILGVI